MAVDPHLGGLIFFDQAGDKYGTFLCNQEQEVAVLNTETDEDEEGGDEIGYEDQDFGDESAVELLTLKIEKEEEFKSAEDILLEPSPA